MDRVEEGGGEITLRIISTVPPFDFLISYSCSFASFREKYSQWFLFVDHL